jgi:hypothetical protein
MGTEETWAGQYSRLECMMNENIEPGLPKENRLSVLSSTDSAIGTTTALTLRGQKEMSGMDCGEEFDCRDANGAGFYMFDTDKMLGKDKPIVHGHWGVYHNRGNAHYSLPGMVKWLYSHLTFDMPLPDVCKPGCEPQYTLPPVSTRRRLLFATQPPAEAIQCLAPPEGEFDDFGAFLANEWYEQSFASSVQATPAIADLRDAYIAAGMA